MWWTAWTSYTAGRRGWGRASGWCAAMATAPWRQRGLLGGGRRQRHDRPPGRAQTGWPPNTGAGAGVTALGDACRAGRRIARPATGAAATAPARHQRRTGARQAARCTAPARNTPRLQHAARRAAIDEEQAGWTKKPNKNTPASHANLLARKAELQLDELSLALEQAQVAPAGRRNRPHPGAHRSRELERHAERAFALSTAQNRLNELEHRRDDLSERRDTLNERQENLVIEQDSLIQRRSGRAIAKRGDCAMNAEEKLIAARDAASHATELCASSPRPASGWTARWTRCATPSTTGG